jgi:hypothetical protein
MPPKKAAGVPSVQAALDVLQTVLRDTLRGAVK